MEPDGRPLTAISIGLIIRIVGIVLLVIAALMGFDLIHTDANHIMGWGFLGLALCWISTVIP